MPFTKEGRKAYREFQREYGIEGSRIFYSYMNKYPKRTKRWHRKK